MADQMAVDEPSHIVDVLEFSSAILHTGVRGHIEYL